MYTVIVTIVDGEGKALVATGNYDEMPLIIGIEAPSEKLQEVIVEDYDNFCDEFCGSEYNVFKPMWHGDV